MKQDSANKFARCVRRTLPRRLTGVAMVRGTHPTPVAMMRGTHQSSDRRVRPTHQFLLTEALRKLWRAIRRISGDDGYERYLAHRAAVHPGAPALPRHAWFAHQLQQKWSGIKRCC